MQARRRKNDDHSADSGTDAHGSATPDQALISHQILAGQSQVLALVAAGAPLNEVLSLLLTTTEEICSGLACGLLLLDSSGNLRPAATGSLPGSFLDTLGELPAGSTIATLYAQIEADPAWQLLRPAASGAGIATLWLEPISTGSGAPLGVICTGLKKAKEPTQTDTLAVTLACQLSGILIDRQRAKDLDHQARARLGDFADVASNWFWEMDADGRFTDIVGGTSEDWAPGKVIGKTPQQVTDTGAALAPVLWGELEPLARREAFHNLHFTQPNPAGENRHFKVSGRPVHNAQGMFVGMRGVVQDVTALKQTEQKLCDAKEHAELASRSKSEFLTNMSHELRTPLNAIIGFSEILQNQIFGPVGNEQYLDYTRDIYDSGKHLLTLINDILDLSKIEAGRFELSEEEFDLEDTVRTAVRLVKPQAEAAGLTIICDCPQGLPRLNGDPGAIKRIVLNLLSNAVKFTPPDGRVTVSIRSREEDGGLEVIVSDTGIGIPPGHLATIMEPFVQVDRTFHRRFEGTGLGLPLANRLLDLHQGSLILRSELDVGTTAVISFPAERVIGPATA